MLFPPKPTDDQPQKESLCFLKSVTPGDALSVVYIPSLPRLPSSPPTVSCSFLPSPIHRKLFDRGEMVGKRKADDNLTGTRHPAARRDPTSGSDLPGTSANNTGPAANAAGDGIAGISPDMAFLLEVTSGYGYAAGSSQFDGGGCPRNQSIRPSASFVLAFLGL